MDPNQLREQIPFLNDQITFKVDHTNQYNRISLDGSATTPPPKAALETLLKSSMDYAPFGRGKSCAGTIIQDEVLAQYNLLANFINAKSFREIVIGQNTTSLINNLAHALKGDFYGFSRLKDGDNIVTTVLEHNANVAPWIGLRNFHKQMFGNSIELRFVDADSDGNLIMDDFAQKIDDRTRIVTVTGKSNVLGSTPNLSLIRNIVPKNALYVIDAAQLAPSHEIDIEKIGADVLVFSLHKMMAPFGVGVMYAKRGLLENLPPFNLGGSMATDVSRDSITYKPLPQRFMGGSPDSLGLIASGSALETLVYAGLNILTPQKQQHQAFTRMMLHAPSSGWDLAYYKDLELAQKHAKLINLEDLFLSVSKRREFGRLLVRQAMKEIGDYETNLTAKAIDGINSIGGFTIHGSANANERYGVVTFSHESMSPLVIGQELASLGIEIRAGKHCAHILHNDVLKLEGTARVSLMPYNTSDEVDSFIDALKYIKKKN